MRDDSPFRDQALRRALLAHFIWDRHLLRYCGHRVDAVSFDAGQGSGPALVVAGLALDFWREHRVPVAESLPLQLARYARSAGLNAEQRADLRDFARSLKGAFDPERSDALRAEVVRFHRAASRSRAIRELAALERSGELDDERWLSTMRSAVQDWGEDDVIDWASGAEERHLRRVSGEREAPLLTLIEELDGIMAPIGRGHMALLLATWKRGKSTFFAWLGIAAVWQDWNVLYFTLEDPVDVVADRMDARVSEVSIKQLGDEGPAVVERVKRFEGMLRARLRIVDCTGGGVTPHRIESIWERMRAEGFDAQLVIVDYDDELRVEGRHDGRRFEFAEIYKQLRQFAARRDLVLWTGAQAKREAENRDIIRGSDAAEDISKVRKVSLCLGLGACTNWNDSSQPDGDAKTLHVIAHRLGPQGGIAKIWSDPKRGTFYDRAKTKAWLRRDEQARAELGG